MCDRRTNRRPKREGKKEKHAKTAFKNEKLIGIGNSLSKFLTGLPHRDRSKQCLSLRTEGPNTQPMPSSLSTLPKVELHVHLDGSFDPEILFTAARKHLAANRLPKDLSLIHI